MPIQTFNMRPKRPATITTTVTINSPQTSPADFKLQLVTVLNESDYIEYDLEQNELTFRSDYVCFRENFGAVFIFKAISSSGAASDLKIRNLNFDVVNPRVGYLPHECIQVAHDNYAFMVYATARTLDTDTGVVGTISADSNYGSVLINVLEN